MSNTYFNISDKLRLYEFDGLLDQYGDAAAAYSLRKLRSGYTGSAIRVRRSSDNTERDIGFWNNELDTIALLDWVNEEYLKYQWDFTASDPYTGFSQGLDNSVGESVAGVDDAIKLTLTGGDRVHDIVPIVNSTSITGQEFRVEFDYYIPSTNPLVDNILLFNFFSSISSSTGNLDVLDEWTSVSRTGTTVDLPGNVDLFFRARAGGDQSPDADGDVFYLKNIRVTQLTADGLVHTWYDQSANANHAVQGTATAQPKIVDAGVVVTENGKIALEFDGADDTLQSISNIGILGNSSRSLYVVEKTNNNLNKTILSYGNPAAPGEFYNFTQEFGIRVSSGANLFELSKTNQTLLELTFPNGSSVLDDFELYIDSQVATQTSNSAPTRIVNTGDSQLAIGTFTNAYSSMNLQEIVFYNSDQSSNRTDIESNINDYYSIY